MSKGRIKLRRYREIVICQVVSVAMSILLYGNSYANTYYIPVGTITDHSDKTVTGSIAWYFDHYKSGNVYKLSSNAVYYISDKLEMEANTELNKSDPNFNC